MAVNENWICYDNYLKISSLRKLVAQGCYVEITTSTSSFFERRRSALRRSFVTA